ncbi:MAG: low temperature requirement protein A [Propionibacteriaceae bacterium]
MLTILQIFGSLVLAAGVESMAAGDFTLGVVGYVIMRVALVAQWLRAARADPVHGVTCRRYAVGILVVQLFWVTLLLVPAGLKVPLFLLGVVLELAVPAFAEHAGATSWHPHHVAERYGLFFIIVLGETILSTTVALESARGGRRGRARHRRVDHGRGRRRWSPARWRSC